MFCSLRRKPQTSSAIVMIEKEGIKVFLSQHTTDVASLGRERTGKNTDFLSEIQIITSGGEIGLEGSRETSGFRDKVLGRRGHSREKGQGW